MNTDKNTNTISIIINDARKKIANAINETNLSPTILEMIVSQLYSEIKMMADNEYKNDLANINESASKEVNNNDKLEDKI